MRGALRRAGPFLAVVLVLAAAACGRDDPLPQRLEARLKAMLGVVRPEASPDEVRQALVRQLRVAPVPAEGTGGASKEVFPTQETLRQFYAKRGHRLAWCDETGKVLPQGTSLLDALRRVGEHGLDPEGYGLSRLDHLGEQIGKGALDDAGVSRLADLDLLLTAAFFRYASDLSTGRVHPDEIRGEWHTNPPEIDFVTELNRALAGHDLTKLLEALPPPHPGYARLRQALQGLRDVEAAGGWPAIPDGPKLEPGSRGPRVGLLRRRLAEASRIGSGAGGAGAGVPEDDRYDGALTETVRRFQERYGIEPDGKVGARALAELNVPVGQRIRQVELNLERWRWIPRRLGDPHVLVNIPGFALELVRGAAAPWPSRIVVGKAYTPTPVFSDRIVAVVVNPPWSVPDSIAVLEYLPELRKDPRALERQRIRLFEGTGEGAREVDPRKVDWDKVDESHFPYRLRQDPGEDNALGRLKFELTNDFHIYLHDTPAGHLFGRSERDLSHGCIRVERALALAAELLGEAPQDRFREALGQAEERRIPVDPPVAVHILYWTAWVAEGGVLHYGPDVYDLDGPQQSALEKVASAR